MRLRITLAYDGTRFHGWAAQPGLRTVEGELTGLISLIFQQDVQLIVAGRTDAGVHAAAQTVHLDVDDLRPVDIPPDADPDHPDNVIPQPQLVRRINKLCASRGIDDIVVRGAEVTFAQFNARFCAYRRHYVYRIGDSVDTWFPTRCDIYRYHRPLNVAAMNAAADAFVGEHDFLGFAKPREGASTVREIYDYTVGRDHDGIIECRVTGDAFCHSQVRFMTGALIDAGRGKITPHDIERRLDRAQQVSGAVLAPAQGLTLLGVDYPETATAMQAQHHRAARYRGD